MTGNDGAMALQGTTSAQCTTAAADEALDIAVDAISRRARVLAGQDPEVSGALLLLASRLDVSAFGRGAFSDMPYRARPKRRRVR